MTAQATDGVSAQDAALEIIATLGEPATSYARALFAADAAGRRFHEAQMAKDINAMTDAQLDRERALAQVWRIKDDGATTWLMQARWAKELYPGCTQEVLDPLYRRELDNTQQAFVELAVRVDDIESATGKVVHS